jgi:Raf kinase inhibitor-like YbhB/YbcL family protein
MKTSVLALLSMTILGATAQAQAPAPPAAPATPGLTLTTTAFADGGIIPTRFTQDTANPVSPKLDWTHVPAGTVTFALIMRDPDTSVNRTTEEILHWMVFNLPATTKGLPENVPAGAQGPDGSVQGKNRRGVNGYLGPGAPMVGPDHHYTFELYALDTKIELTADATRADLLKAMDGHVLGKGVVVGRFHRQVAPAPAAPAAPAGGVK